MKRFAKQFSHPRFGASESRKSIFGLSASFMSLNRFVSMSDSTRFINPFLLVLPGTPVRIFSGARPFLL